MVMLDEGSAGRVGLVPFAVAVCGGGAVAGMGLAVDRIHMVTPARVVNRALGRDLLEPGSPVGASLGAIVPALGGRSQPSRLTYTVISWRPPGRDPASDVAGLEFVGGGTGPLPAVLYAGRQDQLGECSAFGYPTPGSDAGRPVRLVLDQSLAYGYLRVAAAGELAGQAGYDGAPVTVARDPSAEVVVGILTVRDGRQLVATLETLEAGWPEVVGPLAERERRLTNG